MMELIIFLKNKWRSLTRWQKIAFWALFVFASYSLIGFLVLPAVTKPVLQKKLSETLHRQVTLEKIKCNPYCLTMEIQGFRVMDRNDQQILLGFDNFLADIQAASLFKFALILREVKLHNPVVHAIRLDDSSYNFSDILQGDKENESSQDSGSSGKGLQFSINNISITGGRIIFEDSPKKSVYRIEDLSLSVPFISNLDYRLAEYVQPTFKARINGSPIDMGGRSQPFTSNRPSAFSFQLTDLNLVDYLPYLPVNLPLTLRSGILSLDASINLQVPNAEKPNIEIGGILSLTDIDVIDREGNHYLKIPKLTLNVSPSKILEGNFVVSELAVNEPLINLNRLQDGRLLPVDLFPPKNSADERNDDDLQNAGPDVDLTLNKVTVSNATVIFEDNFLENAPLITLDHIQIASGNLSTKNGQPGDLSFTGLLNQQGMLSATGSLSLFPLTANISYEIQKIALPFLQPYIGEKMNVVLAGGLFGGAGKLDFSAGDVETKKHFHLDTDFQLADVSMHDALSGTRLLDVHKLDFHGVSFSLEPVAINLNQILLDGCKVDLQVNKSGELNITLLAKRGTEQDADKNTRDSGKQVDRQDIVLNLETLQIKDGLVTFTDNSIDPRFTARLGDLNGEITSFSNDQNASTDITISGSYDGSAPLSIEGEVKPFAAETSAGIAVGMNNIEMSPFSPYTGKYIGYKAEKGKLFMDILLRLTGKELSVENKFLLDQFTLGDHVESPDAPNLPIQLALALLKNRKGEIHLNIPVSGNLDDPEFSVGGIVFQVIFNLIAKAATSPFALLGALLPAGEDYQHVLFDHNSSRITKDSTEKLDSLAQMLFERPGLKMDLIGSVDYQADAAAMHQNRFDELIKLAKYNSLTKRGKVSESIDTLNVEKEEFANYLKLAYKAATFEKPKNFLGLEKTLPDEEMEQRLRENTIITPEDLRLLALSRANSVRDYLVEQGPVEPERLFVIEPEIQTDEQDTKEEAGKSAVEMVIK